MHLRAEVKQKLERATSHIIVCRPPEGKSGDDFIHFYPKIVFKLRALPSGLQSGPWAGPRTPNRQQSGPLASKSSATVVWLWVVVVAVVAMGGSP